MNPLPPFELLLFYVTLLAGVVTFFYLMFYVIIPLVLEDWGKPILKFWRHRKETDKEEIEWQKSN